MKRTRVLPVPAVVGIVLCAVMSLCTAACGGSSALAAASDSPIPVPSPSVRFAGDTNVSPKPVPTAFASTARCDGLASQPAMSPMPVPGHMPTGSTMAKIVDKRGVLVVGIDRDEYQVGYQNLAPSPPRGQEYRGFDVDILHAVAEALFGDPNKIEYLPVGEDYRMGAANQGVVDLVAASITITCYREQQVHFSVDYLDSGQKLLVSRNDSQVGVTVSSGQAAQFTGLNDQQVCTIGSTTSNDNLVAYQKSGHFRVVLAQNWSDCLVLVQQGKVRALSTDATVLAGIEAEDPYLKIVGDAFSYEPHGLAFPLSDGSDQSNAQFISFVNGVIAQLEAPGVPAYCPESMTTGVNGDTSCWAALYRTWLEPELGPVPGPPTPVYLR